MDVEFEEQIKSKKRRIQVVDHKLRNVKAAAQKH